MVVFCCYCYCRFTLGGDVKRKLKVLECLFLMMGMRCNRTHKFIPSSAIAACACCVCVNACEAIKCVPNVKMRFFDPFKIDEWEKMSDIHNNYLMASPNIDIGSLFPFQFQFFKLIFISFRFVFFSFDFNPPGHKSSLRLTH